jgi:hypothetical protein
MYFHIVFFVLVLAPLVSTDDLALSINIQEMVQNMFRCEGIYYFTPKVELLSIYDNYSQFFHPPVDEYEKKYARLLRHKCVRPASGPAVVDEKQFFFQFDLFTDGLFREFSSWDNILIVGGSVLGNKKSRNYLNFQLLCYPYLRPIINQKQKCLVTIETITKVQTLTSIFGVWKESPIKIKCCVCMSTSTG